MRLLKLCLPCLFLASACAAPPTAPPPAAPRAILFEGARLIAGDTGQAIENSAFLVEDDTITRVGLKGAIQAPAGATRVDLTGKTVMPALVDGHSHLGYTRVRDNSTSAENFTRENLVDHLNRYAYFGIAATLSMGVDRGELPFELRESPAPGAALFRTTGRGIALPNAGPGQDYRRDAPYGIATEEEARSAVRELAARKVDLVKIWVDDRDGTVKKLPPPLYRAIIDEAHKHGLRVTAHIFDLADAKELLRSGLDGFAHGVRDMEIDAELLALFADRPDVFLIPNLPESNTPVDPAWLGETLPPAQVARMAGERANRKPEVARAATALFEVQARNLAKLNAAGVRIAFGTDAGVSVGWTAHTELEDMVTAGMTPAQVIVAATSTAAGVLGLDRLGSVAAGKSADFLVLDANPLDAITNTRRISRVYLRGTEIDRAALRAAWSRPAAN